MLLWNAVIVIRLQNWILEDVNSYQPSLPCGITFEMKETHEPKLVPASGLYNEYVMPSLMGLDKCSLQVLHVCSHMDLEPQHEYYQTNYQS